MLKTKTLAAAFTAALLTTTAANAERFGFHKAQEYSRDGMSYSTYRIALDYFPGDDEYRYATDIQVPAPDHPEFKNIIVDVLNDFLANRLIDDLNDFESYTFVGMIKDLCDAAPFDEVALMVDLDMTDHQWDAVQYRKFRFKTLVGRDRFLLAMNSPYISEMNDFIKYGPEFIKEQNKELEQAQRLYTNEPLFNVRPLSNNDLVTLRKNYAATFVLEMNDLFRNTDRGGRKHEHQLEGRKINEIISAAVLLYPQHFADSQDVDLYEGVLSRYEQDDSVMALNSMMPDYLDDFLKAMRMKDSDIEAFHQRVTDWLHYYDRRRTVPQLAP